jgi:hypothetical protein
VGRVSPRAVHRGSSKSGDDEDRGHLEIQVHSVSLTALTTDTFENAQMNWIALAELGLAVMVIQLDLVNRLLDTVPQKAGQFGLALASPSGLRSPCATARTAAGA